MEEIGDAELKGLRFSMKPYINQEWMENYPLYQTQSVLRSI